MNVGILGANGYAGELLLKYLLTHPHIVTLYASSRSHAGTPLPEYILSSLYTASPTLSDTYYSVQDIQSLCASGSIDVLFSALPHRTSAEVLVPILQNSTSSLVTIDLSADFRYTDSTLYERVYETPHADKSMLKYAIYGLSEWNREFIQKARIIACPGCYPTSILLSIIPIVRYVSPAGLISITSSSGISGAGREAKQHLLFTERNESILPYSIGSQHRHLSEIIHNAKKNRTHRFTTVG